MQPDSRGAPHYISGGHWMCCDRCSAKRRNWDMAKEWTNLIVCKDTCLDPRPPQLDPPNVYPEGLPVPDARPEPPPIFITENVNPEDL